MNYRYEDDETLPVWGIDALGKVGIAIWVLNVVLILWP